MLRYGQATRHDHTACFLLTVSTRTSGRVQGQGGGTGVDTARTAATWGLRRFGVRDFFIVRILDKRLPVLAHERML